MILARYPDACTWRVTDRGIVPAGETEPLRSAGEPDTLRRVLRNFGAALATVPDLQRRRTLAALLATESRGVRDPGTRYEPERHDFSFGPCQELSGTACGYLDRLGIAHPAPLSIAPDADGHPVFARLDDAALVAAWHALLTRPDVALAIAGLYVEGHDAHFSCGGDPIFAYACFNAGSPRPSAHKRDDFELVSTVHPSGKTVLQDFAEFYGDACAVFPAAAPETSA